MIGEWTYLDCSTHDIKSLNSIIEYLNSYMKKYKPPYSIYIKDDEIQLFGFRERTLEDDNKDKNDKQNHIKTIAQQLENILQNYSKCPSIQSVLDKYIESEFIKNNNPMMYHNPPVIYSKPPQPKPGSNNILINEGGQTKY
jgi:uncharacterized protein YpmS